MVAITGLSETWLMESHDSFASIEDLDRGLSSVASSSVAAGDPADPSQDDVLAPSRTMIGLYRPAWSYRPEQAIRLFPKARYFFVSIYRIRPGTDSDFGELIKLRTASFESQNVDRPNLVYQVISGAPGGTFIFFAPLVSLRKMDDGAAPMPIYAEGLAVAKAKDGTRIAFDSEISREHLVLRTDPRVSYVSDTFAALDPEFWRGRSRNP